MSEVFWLVVVAGAWGFATTALIVYTRPRTRRAAQKPADSVEERLGELERNYTKLHGSYLSLQNRFNRARYDDRQEAAAEQPQNGQQPDLSQDPRYSQFFN